VTLSLKRDVVTLFRFRTVTGLDEPAVVDVEIGDGLVDADEPNLPADDRDLERLQPEFKAFVPELW
jgi:hypothetical protein